MFAEWHKSPAEMHSNRIQLHSTHCSVLVGTLLTCIPCVRAYPVATFQDKLFDPTGLRPPIPYCNCEAPAPQWCFVTINMQGPITLRR